jgi:hypothetical protein
LSNRIVASLTACIIVTGATACTLAAYGAYAMRPARVPADLAITAFASEPQFANRAAKTNRLAALLPARIAGAEAQPVYALASVGPSAEAERQTGPVTAAAPSIPAEALLPPAPPAPSQSKPVTTASLPDKPKHLPPPPPPAPAGAGGVLDDGQIAGLKGRLRLSSDQAEYWPAVEAALRDVVRTHLRGTSNRIARGGRMNIDVNSPEVQKLIYAAMPLLMRLREDQKTEVRKLARVIGLERVASQI